MAQLQCYFLGRNTLQYVFLLKLLLAFVFVVVASRLKVPVLGKMLSWLLEGWWCLTSSTAKIYPFGLATKKQCGPWNLKMKIIRTQRKIVRVSGL